jgi:toxin ParE1/3/4
VTETRWRILLSDEAEKDFLRILKYTADTFGEQQFAIYRSILLEALRSLEVGPDLPGSIARDEVRANLRSLHVSRRGRRGRHFILYRADGGTMIEIVRILHDSMDFGRHLPPEL